MSQSVIIDDQEYEYDYVTDSLVLKTPVLSNDLLFENHVNAHAVSHTLTRGYGQGQGQTHITITDDMIYNYNPDFWAQILKRELTRDEMKIFHTIWAENTLNQDIKKLQQILKASNYIIKSKTNNNGNCLFESLKESGIGFNHFNIPEEEFIRLELSDVLNKESNNKNFFPNINMSPKEIFTNTNVEQGINYDLMLDDLKTNHSWKKLPAELILMCVSKVYNVGIVIHHNKSHHQNMINCCIGSAERVIHLGQINEEHYLPVVEYFDGDICSNIEYTTGIEMFEKWIFSMG